ncbi:PEP-CTERM sorting domain-containing protein [Cerasicoccus frondis]|uniref:PEP-CTERM sorting domain-containing protein n=1 Tax=Cerasicoccus frondis TaxID=490090 RepID=UPI0028528449|nr:PEP-CTERM sorting domain-containing protein [Cerasicoccus frondis]
MHKRFMRTYTTSLLLGLLGLSCSLQAESDHAINVYIFEYNSNLYMTMYGSHQTDPGEVENFEKKTKTVDYSTLETSITPKDGIVSFLDSSYTSDEYTIDEWSSSWNGWHTLVDESDSGGYDFGKGDTITFDSGTTYSASSGESYLFRFAHTYDSGLGHGAKVYIEKGYDQSNTMAFFSMASGKTLDDIDLSNHSDESVSFTSTNDVTYDFDAYYFQWKVHQGPTEGKQYYNFTIAETDDPELIADVIAYSGGFTVSELEEMYELIYDGNTSSGGDEFLVDPTVPEPSTYALILGSLTLGAVFWQRRRG